MYLNSRETEELLRDLRLTDPNLAEKWDTIFKAAAWVRRNHPDYPKGGPKPSFKERLRFLFQSE